MEHDKIQDKTVRDLFPALVVQLERETSETPSIESDGSAVSIVQSPTPRANTLQDSVAASVSRPPQFDISLSTTTPYPSLTTECHESNAKHISPVSLVHPVPHPPLLSSNLENKVESSRLNISSRGTNTQVPSSPVRSAGIPPAPVGGYSEQYLPTASNTVLSPGERAKDVTPIVIPRLKLVVNEPQEDSTNASKSPKDVTPIAVPRLKLVVNEPREDSTNAKESPKDVTPIATPRLKLFFKPKSRQPILDSIPSTAPSDPASSEHLSSPTNPGNRSSNMSPPKPSAESTSYESSSDYEASTSINATSDLPATSESPKPSSSSDEAPSRDAGHLSPLNFVPTPAMNPSLDPSMDPSMGPYMDPYQPTDSAVMPGISPFEDPNVRPSTFIFPEETPDYSSVPIDPMGVYTPEQYARILASEEEVLREMADMHTDTPTYMYDRRVEQNYTTVADLDRIFAEMEAASDGIDILQPEYWAAIGRDLPGPSSQSGVLESNQPAHAQPASETLQSVEEAEPGSAKKRARYSSPKAKSSTPELSSTISARTSVSDQRRSTSSRTKTVSPPPASIQTCRHSKNQAATPPAQTSTSSRRRSKNKAKTEVDTPEVPVSVSPRRLRSSGVMPTSSAKKNPKGNATPESWETAPTADKMMSQMKESSMPWMDITAAWNENRNESDDEMTWRALSKRWGRIRERIGPWPGFDELLLDTLGAFDPKLDDDDFAQIAEEVSSGLGWEVSSEACQVRYETLKESGKIDVKGKGRARK